MASRTTSDFVQATPGTEESFVLIAMRLGIQKLHFIQYKGTAKELDALTKKLPSTILCSPARAITAADAGKDYGNNILVIYRASDELRSILERTRSLHVHSAETLASKDGMHARNSGLNHILASIMHERGHTYLFNLSILLDASDAQRALLFGRMRQNARLLRKYKVPYYFASFAQDPHRMRSPHDLDALTRLLLIS